jgi:AcrR family transcriptional regulator
MVATSVGVTASVPYRRSTGSARGEARRAQLLELVTEDLAQNGLVDFSLRRAARAAGTTHKVLLYHFDGVEDLLGQAMRLLRARRLESVLAVTVSGDTLAAKVDSMWPVLMDDASGLRVIDQAIGLAMHDPQRYAHLARDASDQYRGPLLAMCPDGWTERRKQEVAEMILATMRGFLMEWRTVGDSVRIQDGLAALVRAVQREEDAG